MSDPFNDIATAIIRLSMAMKEHHMNAPAAIDLYAPEDGARLMRALPKEQLVYVEYGRMRPETGEPVNQIEIAGVIVRWPAQKRLRRDGGFDWC